MILQALVDYYDRRQADASASDLAPAGFSEEKFQYRLDLDAAGRPATPAITDIRDPSGKKPQPRRLLVPQGVKRTVAVAPNFLWDKASYLLGYDPEDPARAARCFAAFRDRHLAAEAIIADPGFTAFCAFLRTWDPATAVATHPDWPWADLVGANLVVRVAPHLDALHDLPGVKAGWARLQASAEASAETGVQQCLVTDTIEPIARLHPSIKGVDGTQSSGASIVSFNLDAFTSHGKEQNYNAPIGETAAFKYTTALNKLLRERRVRIGDASCVFWTGGEERAFDEFLEKWFAGRAEDPATTGQAGAFLDYLRRPGGPLPTAIRDARTDFFLLGLSPNAARISIRFFLHSNVGQLLARLQAHFAALSLVRQYGDNSKHPDPLFPHPDQLVLEAAPPHLDYDKRRAFEARLSGPLLRAVLEGGPYPDAWFQALLRRIRLDRDVNYLRVAGLKAFLTRQLNQPLPMSLDLARTDPPYRLGRLFAALEQTQSAASGGNLNATIKDRFFGGALGTPAAVFPRLIKLNQHHLAKLRSDRPGLAVHLDRAIQDIVGPLQAFPSTLTLEEQGLFTLGYYHQRQAFFTKTETEAQPAA